MDGTRRAGFRRQGTSDEKRYLAAEPDSAARDGLLAALCRARTPGRRLRWWKSIRSEEIIVTAKRRNEDLQTTQHFRHGVERGTCSKSKGVTDLYALQYAAPAVTVTQYGSANVFNIRGHRAKPGRHRRPIGCRDLSRWHANPRRLLPERAPISTWNRSRSIAVRRERFVGKNAAGGAVFINTQRSRKLGEEVDGSVELGGGGYYGPSRRTGIVNIPHGRNRQRCGSGYRHNERDNFYDSITGDYTGNPGEVDNNSLPV